jgi:uroporphyrinogen-III synthase
MTSQGPLVGRTIALPETRELDRLAHILEEDGATTLRCPMVAILDAPDPGPVDAWLDEFCATAFDDLILLTGEGLRRLLSRARATDREAALIAALTRTRKITRGPKPARALHEIGLSSDRPATPPTSQGVMDTLAGDNLAGRRVGLQLYGTEPNEPLVRFLVSRGAFVRTVAPYVYAPASDEERVVQVIHGMAAGTVDVMAFTSASQVERLFAVATARSVEPALRAGLGRVKVAAVGPIAESALASRGVAVAIVPEQPFIMKRLTAAIVAALTS